MTIAAGIVCRDAVLLCADTEYSGYAAKSIGPKMGEFDCPGGKIGFALAGGSHFAWSAVEKLKQGLQLVSPEETMAEAEAILEAEYRRHVFTHPSFPHDQSLPYWLLLVLQSPHRPVKLFVTSETALRPIHDCACIGLGGETGEYLIRLSFYPHMADRRAFHLASYALARVKRSIQGCGGGTTFLILRKDGSLGQISSYQDCPAKHIEEFSLAYDRMSQDLLLRLANFEGDDTVLEKHIQDTFVRPVLQVRTEWREAQLTKEKRFAELNQSLTPYQVRQACLQRSIGFDSVPQGSV